MNPALSFILDGYFGYYGAHAADFAALDLPPAGDDPSVTARVSASRRSSSRAGGHRSLPGGRDLPDDSQPGRPRGRGGYLVTTGLPANLQIKAGTFRSQVGRNNTQHLHLQSFTRRPLMTAPLFGADGFAGPGAQAVGAGAAALVHDDLWRGVQHRPRGGHDAPRDVRRRRAHDTEEPHLHGGAGTVLGARRATSILLGANFATGRVFDCMGAVPCDLALAAGPRSYLYGGDLYFKWKPPNESQTYASLQWTTEWFARRSRAAAPPRARATRSRSCRSRGASTWAGVSIWSAPERAQPAPPLRLRGVADVRAQRVLAPAPVRAGADGIGDVATVAFLQVEYSMGAHGAHPY
jgi:hypothetical protein